MTILELNQFDELNDFGTDWNQLLSKSLDNHPFLTSQWLTSWWKHFGKDKELKLFAAKSEGKPSIVIPVMYSTCRTFGSKRRKVSFVAAPDSDYQVFLVTNLQEASRTVNQLIGTIMEDSAADCVVFGEVPEDSVTAKLLKDANVNGSGVSSSVINSCPYIPLPNNTDIFLQNLGSKMRRNLKVGEKQASKDFQVKFVKYDEIGTVEEAMNILFDLHQKREIAIGNFGVFSNEVNKSFHMQVAK